VEGSGLEIKNPSSGLGGADWKHTKNVRVENRQGKGQFSPTSER